MKNQRRGGPRKQVPANFEELMTMFPNVVEYIVRRYVNYSLPKHRKSVRENYVSSLELDFEEYLQETLLHLWRLPTNSKYRELGYTDPIQIYDPSLCPESILPLEHFKSYLTVVIYRHLITYRTKQRRDAMTQKLESWEPHTVMVDEENRLNQKVMVSKCIDCLSGDVKMTPKGHIYSREWQKLAAKLGVEPTEKLKTRVSVLITKNFSVLEECRTHPTTFTIGEAYAPRITDEPGNPVHS